MKGFNYAGISLENQSDIYINIYIFHLFSITVTIISGKAVIFFLNPHFSFRLISLDNILRFFALRASVVMF